MATQTPTFANANFLQELAFAYPISNLYAGSVFQQEIGYLPLRNQGFAVFQQEKVCVLSLVKSSSSVFAPSFATALQQKQSYINNFLQTTTKFQKETAATIYASKFSTSIIVPSFTTAQYQKQSPQKFINFNFFATANFQKELAFGYPIVKLYGSANFQKGNAVGNLLCYRQMTTNVSSSGTTVISSQFQS